MNTLKKYDRADIAFFATKINEDDVEFTLEEGTEFIYDEVEKLSDKDIKQWAEEEGYLSKNSKYISKHGIVNFDALRELKNEDDKLWQEENSTANATPIGRAFKWFIEKKFDFPNDLGIEIVDGVHPGNDWQGVNVDNYESLVRLQFHLEIKGFKVNFITS
ncbi:hypothetical protein OAE07_03565 [Winogradskyella sp.]|nr:hypothetical protein [Winogradskyella sp.]MDC1505888.1 hypothetical protein [Winogradskyella sp.]